MTRRCDTKEVQEIEFEILKNFREFCNANDLKYFLAYGTLLGAVRHKGFIPWDDDVDVFMLREDYMRFLNLTKNQLINSIYRVDMLDRKDNYDYPFCKMVNINTELIENGHENKTGVYIDIFPLDFVPENEADRARLCKKMKFLIRKARLSMKLTKESNFVKRTLRRIAGPILRLIGTKKLLKKIDEAAIKANLKHSRYVGNLVWGDGVRDYYELEDMLCDNYIEFEGEAFLAPSNVDKVLTNLYGDYMQLPPEDQRNGHGMEAYILKED